MVVVLKRSKINFQSYSTTTSALALFIVHFLFSVLFALLYFAFFFLCWYFLKKITSYKPGCGGFGDITNLEPVVGGLFSRGKPQPTFVSDEVAACLTETRLQSLILSRKLTETVRLLGVKLINFYY